MKHTYKGNHSYVTIGSIQFKKDEPIELTDDQVKRLNASGFFTAMLKSGEIVKDDTKTPAKAKTTAKTSVKSPVKADTGKE